MAIAEFSKYADILTAALKQHRLLGFEIAQLEFHYQRKPVVNVQTAFQLCLFHMLAR